MTNEQKFTPAEVEDARRNPRKGDKWRGSRKDGHVITMRLLKGKPRITAADGQFTYTLPIGILREFTATATLIERGPE